jgi:phosphocarrier protein
MNKKAKTDTPAVSNMEKITKEFLIENKLGLHARPAAMFVRIANKYPCDVWVEKDNEEVNGKSIMGLMMLAAGNGTSLKVSAIGAGAKEVLSELEDLIKRKFDEE